MAGNFFQKSEVSPTGLNEGDNGEDALLRALVANDDSFQMTVVRTLLKQCGFAIDEAENG